MIKFWNNNAEDTGGKKYVVEIVQIAITFLYSIVLDWG